MAMDRNQTREYRWGVLDKLLGRGVPLTQQQIFDEYKCNGITERIKIGNRERKNPQVFQTSFQKDISLFRKTLEKKGYADMLVEDRAPEDTRIRRYYYRIKGFSIIDFLTGGMSDSEYHRLVNTINKLSDVVSNETFDEVRFAIQSRVEADYQKGPVYVAYEDNRRLTGREHRSMIYRAMMEKQVLHILYHTFKGEKLEYDFHPYLLKQYNERWFAFGWSQPYGLYTSVPLDRLESKPTIVGNFSEARPEKYSDYFDERVGVSKGMKKKSHIIIRITDQDAWGRITTKPLNGQKEVEPFDDSYRYGKISLDVFPNPELYSKILSWGEGVEIESPAYVRARMVELLKKISGNYSEIWNG